MSTCKHVDRAGERCKSASGYGSLKSDFCIDHSDTLRDQLAFLQGGSAILDAGSILHTLDDHAARIYLAGQALAGMLASRWGDGTPPDDWAVLALRQADAVLRKLKERRDAK